MVDIDNIDKQKDENESEKQQRKIDTLRWLEEHCDWQPFGDVW